MGLKNLIGVKEVLGQQIIQEPLYTSSGMIDWEGMAKAQESIFIWIDHETNTISFKMKSEDEGGCTPADIINVANFMIGRVLQ